MFIGGAKDDKTLHFMQSAMMFQFGISLTWCVIFLGGITSRGHKETMGRVCLVTSLTWGVNTALQVMDSQNPAMDAQWKKNTGVNNIIGAVFTVLLMVGYMKSNAKSPAEWLAPTAKSPEGYPFGEKMKEAPGYWVIRYNMAMLMVFGFMFVISPATALEGYHAPATVTDPSNALGFFCVSTMRYMGVCFLGAAMLLGAVLTGHDWPTIFRVNIGLAMLNFANMWVSGYSKFSNRLMDRPTEAVNMQIILSLVGVLMFSRLILDPTIWVMDFMSKEAAGIDQLKVRTQNDDDTREDWKPLVEKMWSTVEKIQAKAKKKSA